VSAVYSGDSNYATSTGSYSQVVLPSAPQGGWVGTYGAQGYDLAAWDGGSDVVSMAGVSVSLIHGSRYVWATGTSDARALENAAGTSSNAATFYDPNQIDLQMSFSSAYSGNLELYAVDWDSLGRTETISVGGQSESISGFSQGVWLTFPINQAAGSTLTITVQNTGPVNAVLSGLFLGGGGTPPAPPGASAPQGSWVGNYGAAGYDLAAWDNGSDVVSMPGASVSLIEGSRYVWATGTSDVRALENAAGTSRNAATYYSSNQIDLQMSFSSAYSGNLELYAVDWDSKGRTETISVGGQSQTISDFSQGVWLTFPISQTAGSTLTISVLNTGPANAVLSGIFLDGAATPPALPSSAPQGGWVGTYGAQGYDLAAWDGGSDVESLPGASVSLIEGSRYVWATGTSDARALENAAGTSSNAATYYSPNQIDLQMNFSSAYSGNLELYAVDWDSLGRTETISVGSQSQTISDFSQGVWLTFPITQAAGSTLTISVLNTGPANAVLSGLFLGGGGTPPALPSSAPQGNWVTQYGAQGYDLAAWNGGSDVLSPGMSVSLLQGSRYVWATGTSDMRALEDPTASTRNAATYYDPNQIDLQMNFSSAYTGNLELYAVDWDSLGRTETITVGGQTQSISDFSQGVWLTFPISQAAGSTLTITVQNTGPVNAVLSGIFLN
jgi:hypothetical protein